MSNKNSFEFYSLWEEINNDNFNSVKLHGIKINEVPYNRFTMTPNRWIKEYNSIGFVSASGKYSSGTYAHPDIAFEFASWISPEFKIYLIKEFRRLKQNEIQNNSNNWDECRFLSKSNYLLQTDAVKNYIVPKLTNKQIKYIYAEEADVLNVALFGTTAKEWRINNPIFAKEGNIRDYSNTIQLIILSNLEAINSELIRKNIPQSERLITLNKIARNQMNTFINNRLKTNEKNQLLIK